MLLQGAVEHGQLEILTSRLCQSASLGFVLILLYSYVASKQKTSFVATWLLRFWRSHPWDVVGSLCWRIKSDPEDAEHLSHESTDRQERGGCSPKFNSHFGVVVISSIMPYRWETLPKLTFMPVICNPHPITAWATYLIYGYQKPDLSPASVQQSCFAWLQSNIDSIVV